MVVENMSQLGRTIFFQTLIPNDDPCGDGANNWTYAINPFTGGRTSHNAFDYRPTTDIGTTNVSAIRQDGEGAARYRRIPTGHTNTAQVRSASTSTRTPQA